MDLRSREAGSPAARAPVAAGRRHPRVGELLRAGAVVGALGGAVTGSAYLRSGAVFDELVAAVAGALHGVVVGAVCALATSAVLHLLRVLRRGAPVPGGWVLALVGAVVSGAVMVPVGLWLVRELLAPGWFLPGVVAQGVLGAAVAAWLLRRSARRP